MDSNPLTTGSVYSNLDSIRFRTSRTIHIHNHGHPFTTTTTITTGREGLVALTPPGVNKVVFFIISLLLLYASPKQVLHKLMFILFSTAIFIEWDKHKYVV